MMRTAAPSVTIAASVFTIAAAVNLQVPLYTTYAGAGGLGNGGLSLMFATYAAALIPVLLLFGGISDVAGRKPVLIAGMLASLAATAAMLLVPSASMLFLARALQGISVGLSMSTATAWLVDLGAQQRASFLVASASALGFGAGALATSIFLMRQQTLRPPSFVIMLALTVITAGCLVALPDVRHGGTLAPMPPSYPRGTIAPSLAVLLAWTASSVVISLVPAQLAAVGLRLWSGPTLFAVNATGFAVQLLARRMQERPMLLAGCAIAPFGFALLVLGSVRGSLMLILFGAALTGSTAYGFVYVGGLRAVVAAAGPQKARAVAGYFLAAYVGFSLPAVGAGFLADRMGADRVLYVLAALLVAGELLAIFLLLREPPRTVCASAAVSNAQPQENVTPAPP